MPLLFGENVHVTYSPQYSAAGLTAAAAGAQSVSFAQPVVALACQGLLAGWQGAQHSIPAAAATHQGHRRPAAHNCEDMSTLPKPQ
jgi:hypothetical protein